MQIAGNLLLILATLAAGSLFNLTFLKKMPSGDARVGHAWVTLICLAVFWLCIILVAIALGWSGGFEWLSLGRFASAGMLALSFLVLLLGANLGLYRPPPIWLRHIAILNAVATPVVLLAAFAILLNPSLKMAVPADPVKWGLGAVLALNSLLLISTILGSVISRTGLFITRTFSNELDSNDIRMIEHIDSHDASKGIRSLLIYSGDNQHPKVREKAVAKIKSKPDWQNDLIETLRSERVDEVFRFLGSNEVDDKALFTQPVYDGVLSLAKVMRERLRNSSHPSHVYSGLFVFEVVGALRVVDKYQGTGVEYKPAVQELRAALEQRIRYDKPEFSCARVLDKWLKRH